MTGVGAVAPVDAPAGESPLPGAPEEGFGAELLAAVRGQARPRFVTLGQMATGALHPSLALPAMANAALAPPAAAAPAAATPAAAPAAPAGEGLPGKIEAAAKRYLGVPYKWGGTNPATGLDCSGFTQRVFADLGIRLPRVSIDQSRAGTAVPSLAEAQPGDLVFRRGSPNHIGIYLGDGRFIHAPRTGDVVKIAPLTWTPDAIRRVR